MSISPVTPNNALNPLSSIIRSCFALISARLACTPASPFEFSFDLTALNPLAMARARTPVDETVLAGDLAGDPFMGEP